MKVLIISHNPLSTFESMGKSLLEMTRVFKKEELIQLYVYPSVPNVDRCASYFRITDKDILKSYFFLPMKIGVVEAQLNQNSLFENEKDEKVYRNPKNKRPLMMLLRDAMWRCSKWYRRSLVEWLKTEKPDCILAAPGGAKFLYDMASKISKDLEIPVFSYLCDEFYFLPKAKKITGRIQNYLLKKTIEKYYYTCVKHVFCICDNLKKLYKEKFGVECTTIMTGASIPFAKKPKLIKDIHTISYLGNLRCDRYKSLVEIGECIDKLNETYNKNIKIHIYSNEKNDSILKYLKRVESIVFEGFVSGEKFTKVVNESDILIHTESFDGAFASAVKNSISTKIADSLACGVPILAYGPEGIASMDYLEKNNAAYCIVKKENLFEKINYLILHPESTHAILYNSLALARNKHDSTKNSALMKDIMMKEK